MVKTASVDRSEIRSPEVRFSNDSHGFTDERIKIDQGNLVFGAQMIDVILQRGLSHRHFVSPSSTLNYTVTGHRAYVCSDNFSCYGAAKAATTNLSKL
jgi:hypothetical protein